MIEDPLLPGLRDLSPDGLSAMTGEPQTRLLRVRYRKGHRAILHVESEAGEGVVWIFKGDKAGRVARRNKPARYHPAAGSVFEVFPSDHRLPEVASLMRQWSVFAADLGCSAEAGLELVRYRPGLSATFRFCDALGRPVYVKVIGDDEVKAINATHNLVARSLRGGPIRLAPVLGACSEVRAISYAGAEGTPLDIKLIQPDGLAALDLALTSFVSLRFSTADPGRRLDPAHLHRVAWASRDTICTIFPGLSEFADFRLESLNTLPEPTEFGLIHADMKLEHLFLSGSTLTLIDTETMSYGPVDYDLAMLAGRIRMAQGSGRLNSAVAQAAVDRIQAEGGPGFAWCRAIVSLRLAKFHAEHPHPLACEQAMRLLESL